MLTLLIAAMGKQKKELCREYSITIKGVRTDHFFLDKTAIAAVLKTAAQGNIKGQPRSSFNLQRMEQLLEDNVWVKDAQLYFDNQAVLHISVEEREPVARIFTAGGRSFYIDDSNQSLPLSENMVAKVPVFTGFPDKRKWTGEDSALLRDINTAAQYISAHSFWAAQVAQVDIITCGPGCWEFEMIPVVGRHLVKLGNGDNTAQKFRRLFAFYQQVLSRTGMDHYKTIDVRFAGQVVGVKSENPKIDSAQVRRNVEELLQQVHGMDRDDVTEQQPIAENRPVAGAAVETGNAGRDRPAVNAVATPVDRRPVEPPGQTTPGNDGNRTPKAVMPRRTER